MKDVKEWEVGQRRTGSQRQTGLTFAAGWGEVFHQGCKKIVELQEIKKEIK